jgi:hypothetical protein
MAYENIIFQVDEGIATISFNRPKALNALNAALIEEFSQALDEIAADEDIRVLVLTGAGDKSFVAGADINELATYNSLTAKHFARIGHNILAKLQELPIVVIAAVNLRIRKCQIRSTGNQFRSNSRFRRHPKTAAFNRHEYGQRIGIYRQNDFRG